jgi:hypothetical protein
MPNTTDLDALLMDINKWDIDKCSVIEKMVNACPAHLRAYIDEPARLFNEGGVVHKSIQYYLYLHFKKLEDENGKTEC